MNQSKRGRPKLDESKKKKKSNWSISPDVIAEVNRVLPEGSRGQFVENAIREALAKLPRGLKLAETTANLGSTEQQ